MMDRAAFVGPGMMLLSAAIFGYFGFSSSFNPVGQNGQFLLYVPILEWTLKGSAIAFLVAAGLSFVQPLVGQVLYSGAGLLGAGLLLLVGVLDLLDTQHTVMSPFLLLIFAVWNGMGSLAGLKAVLGRTPGPPGPGA